MIQRVQTFKPDSVRGNATFSSLRGDVLQRKCACGGTAGPSGECEECRKKGLLRKIGSPNSNSKNNSLAPPIVREVLQSPGQPLDKSARSFMEVRFGHDFGNVRVHADSKAADSARAVSALAYTVGNHTVFGAGHYEPRTTGGLHLLAHELAHVVQQRGAAVTGRVSDLQIGSPHDTSEHEADSIAAAVLRGASVSNSIQRRGFLQREIDELAERPPDAQPSPGPAAVPAPRGGKCGPKVTTQFRHTLREIESTYARWSAPNKQRACQRILVPVTPGGSPDINGWDTIPLFQGASNWLRRPPIHGPCATPSSSDPTNTDPFAPGHEDPATCSNSVEFGGGCWLNGTVNYGTFGIMVRLCERDFTLGTLLGGVGQEQGLPSEVGDAVSWLLGGSLSLIDWAELLIRGYKLWKGSSTDTPDLPIAWVRAFYNGGSAAAPPSGPNRSGCLTTCRLDGSRQRWNWVWEPVHPR